MKIIHHITAEGTPEIIAELAAMGIIVVPMYELTTFDLDEAHESWPRVQRWITERKALDIIATKFTRQEIASSRWLGLVPDWHHGYPQPNEDTFGYQEATYDTSELCGECGMGARQKAPFQMKREPSWGRKGILQLNWIFDEYFATPEVWHRVFEPYGISCRPVLSVDGAQLKTVRQLVVEEEVEFMTDGLRAETCEVCGRTRYLPDSRGPFPALAAEPKGHAAKTKQYFGSGASSNRCIVVSQSLARAFEAQGVRGASLRPVAAVGIKRTP